MDFIISHAGKDQRPYLEIKMLDVPMLGLLDSGSSRTLVNNEGYKVLKNLGLHLISCHDNCTVANGQQCSTLGYVTTPITLKDKIHLIDILVVPEISQQLILGIDFWKSMNIIPNLNENVWHFVDNIDSIDLTTDQGLLSHSSLSMEQKHRLNCLISGKLEVMGNNLGYCTAGSHSIELLPGTNPIKQRYYPVSPY